MKYVQKYAYGLWMGLGLGFCGISYSRWEWWLFVIPMVFLVEWKSWLQPDHTPV